jgi:hypothetical protein
VFGNVRSIQNKIDDLRGNCRFLYEYRDSCIIGLTETWLDSSVPDAAMDVAGFQLVRQDRSTVLTGKTKGGGVALYINEQWSNNVCIKQAICTADIEVLSVSTRPFYLPREFSNVFVTIFYIPPGANKAAAVEVLHEYSNELMNGKPSAVHIVCGDANHCVSDVKKTLRGYRQYVTCNTRFDAVLDLFLCNVVNAYRCRKLPPIMSSDHNMIQLIPAYKPKLKQSQPRTVMKPIMNEASIDTLNACWYCTDWDLFVEDSQGDVNVLTNVVTAYIKFCCDSVLPMKSTKIFENNKPWMTSDLRQAIVEKHSSYGQEIYKEKQQEVHKKILNAKRTFKDKIEDMFHSRNSREVWKGLKVLTGANKKISEPALLSQLGSADRLNKFYARFDHRDFTHEHNVLRNTLTFEVSNSDFKLPEDSVRKALNKIKINKAAGPDNISGKVLKLCKDSLFYIVHQLFELSLSTCIFPSSWKIGEIIPVSKKDLPQTDNDLRPVTLTSILSKCLERVGLDLLLPHVQKYFDPMQFAYVSGRSTDDAISTLLHQIFKHLDVRSSNTVRALFIDYSSAFNTIQPHLLISKLSTMQVPAYLQLWILDYLTRRPQYVRTKLELSDMLTLNTGAPQGCVMSPVLFVLYTNDLAWNTKNACVMKYADDTVIAGLIENDCDREYKLCTEFVNNWCVTNFLDLNVQKTREVVWDFRRKSGCSLPVIINNLTVEVAPMYKYLGVLLDDKFTFRHHVEQQLKKVQKHMYCLRCMKKLSVDPCIICLFFNATITSVLLYACASFYGMLSKCLKEDMERPRKICCRLLSASCKVPEDFDAVYKSRTLSNANRIRKDAGHPLNKEFELLPSGRRLRVQYARTSRYRDTFIPKAIVLLNAAS